MIHGADERTIAKIRYVDGLPFVFGEGGGGLRPRGRLRN